jgi:integration host factor subunit beta
MTKSILIDRLCERCQVPAGRAEQILNAVFDAVEQALSRGERVEIRGFGSFEMREYKAYVGRNPRTGSSVEVKPKRLPFFKVGKELKDRVELGARSERAGQIASAVAKTDTNSHPNPSAPLHTEATAGAP